MRDLEIILTRAIFWIRFAQSGSFGPDLDQLDEKNCKNSFKKFTMFDILFQPAGSGLSFNTKNAIII